MLNRLLESIKPFLTKLNPQFKALPSVRLELVDLEMEDRDQKRMYSFYNEDEHPPLGLEYRFEAYIETGEMVCYGKIAHLPGECIHVNGIETLKDFRRNGYGSSSILELSQLFDRLPIVPVKIQSDGIKFWPAVRKLFAGSILIQEEISSTESGWLVQQVSDSGKSRDYTPQRASQVLKRVKPSNLN